MIEQTGEEAHAYWVDCQIPMFTSMCLDVGTGKDIDTDAYGTSLLTFGIYMFCYTHPRLDLPVDVPTCVPACLPTCFLHDSIHACMHACMHACVHMSNSMQAGVWTAKGLGARNRRRWRFAGRSATAQRVLMETFRVEWEFPKIWVPYFGALIISILLFRVLY